MVTILLPRAAAKGGMPMPYKDPEKRREHDRDHRAANREKVREQSHAYYVANQGLIIEKERGRRAGRSLRDKRVSHLRLRHGMRPEDWAALWEAQQGLCYLCGEELELAAKIAIDHDHGCCPPQTSFAACRRGLAHEACNLGIGKAGDDPDRLRRWADALEAAQQAYRARKAFSASAQPSLFE